MKKCVIAVFMLVLFGVCACSAPVQQSTQQSPVESAIPKTPVQTEAPQQQEPEENGIRIAQTVKTGSGVTVKTASQWANEYADIYASYMKNSENDRYIDHVEEFPMIATLYEGMAFSKYYNSARGHAYTVDDITSTGRPHALANCFSCKTPDFTATVNELGDEAYTIPFEDMLAKVNEAVSCYNCHANTPEEIVVTHTYLSNAMGNDFEKVDAATLACAQCHVEYYFDPETKAVILPYSGLSTMNPDDILKYYSGLSGEGFADYVNPRSGVRQIKLQHPEFETFMGEKSVHASTFTCADCHMGVATNANGETYTSHYWTSPLNNEALIESTCSACHADIQEHVHSVQGKVGQRVDSVGNLLVDITEKLVKAVESNAYTEEELNAVRDLMRSAQFYWDFVFVENSDGAHNSNLALACLDKSEALANEAASLFK